MISQPFDLNPASGTVSPAAILRFYPQKVWIPGEYACCPLTTDGHAACYLHVIIDKEHRRRHFSEQAGHEVNQKQTLEESAQSKSSVKSSMSEQEVVPHRAPSPRIEISMKCQQHNAGLNNDIMFHLPRDSNVKQQAR